MKKKSSKKVDASKTATDESQIFNIREIFEAQKLANVNSEDFIDETIQMIGILGQGQEAKKLNIIFEWILNNHVDKLLLAFNMLTRSADVKTIKEIVYLEKFISFTKPIKNKDNVKSCSKVTIKINEEKFENFIGGPKKAIPKDILTLYECKINLFLAFIAIDMHRIEIACRYLDDIIKNSKTYHNKIKNDQTREYLINQILIVVKCLKNSEKIAFIDRNEKIFDDLAYSPTISDIYLKLLININQFEKLDKFIAKIENNIENPNNYENMNMLYALTAQELVNISKVNLALKYALKFAKNYQSNLKSDNILTDTYYKMLAMLINIGSNDEINEIINNIKDENNKEFLLIFKFYIDADNIYNNQIKFLEAKINNIDKDKLHPSLIQIYNLITIYIKYSKIKYEHIKEVDFFIDLGGINSKKITAPAIIDLCVKFKQTKLAQTYIKKFSIDQFTNNYSYLLHKYTLLKINPSEVIEGINNYICENQTKAKLYYSIALHHARHDDFKYAAFCIEQVNDLYDTNILLKQGDLFDKFSLLKRTIEDYQTLEMIQQIIQNTETQIEDKFKPQIDENIIEELNINSDISNKEKIEQSKDSNIVVEEKQQNNSSTTREVFDEEEPDYSSMTSQEIYYVQEKIRINSQLKTLKEQERNENISSSMIPKNIISWNYNGKVINKDNCHKLYQSIGNKSQKYYVYIDPKLKQKIGNIEPFERALKKGDIGRHKQNGVMIDHKAIKITADTDDRVFSNKIYHFFINNKEYRFISFDRLDNHKGYKDFCNNSSGIEHIFATSEASEMLSKVVGVAGNSHCMIDGC